MSSLRERLAAKQRRRIVVPIQMSDSTEDQNVWMGIASALRLAEKRLADAEDDAAREHAQSEVDQSTALLDEQQAAIEAHFVQIELQSLPNPEWEAAMQQWHDGDRWDWSQALAPLLAASCVDAELQDEEYWAGVLQSPEWTNGDRDGLIAGLLHVNVTRADLQAPKG